MKVFLMHPDRDFDIAPTLRDATLDAMLSGNPFALDNAVNPASHPSREPTQPPSVLELLAEDLDLESLFAAMADGDSFLLETSRRALLSGLTDPGSTPKTVAAISAWKSRPDLNASMRRSSPLSWAINRISICE